MISAYRRARIVLFGSGVPQKGMDWVGEEHLSGNTTLSKRRGRGITAYLRSGSASEWQNLSTIYDPAAPEVFAFGDRSSEAEITDSHH